MSALEALTRYFRDPVRPDLAIEFTSTALSGARVEVRSGRRELAAVASAALPEGAFEPALDDPGFAAKEALREALRALLTRLGAPPDIRAALIVPDSVVRFRLFPASEAPPQADRRADLIAFRMQKLLPFPAEEVRVVSAFPRRPEDPALALGFSRPVLRAYEHAAEAFGLDVGQVETSTTALLKGVPGGGDSLLVRHDPRYLTMALIRDGWPVSIRSFDSSVARRGAEIRREIASTAVFWRDRLAGERLAEGFVHASDAAWAEIAAEVEGAFGLRPVRASAPATLATAGVQSVVERQVVPALTLLGAS